MFGKIKKPISTWIVIFFAEEKAVRNRLVGIELFSKMLEIQRIFYTYSGKMKTSK